MARILRPCLIVGPRQVVLRCFLQPEVCRRAGLPRPVVPFNASTLPADASQALQIHGSLEFVVQALLRKKGLSQCTEVSSMPWSEMMLEVCASVS